MCAFFSTLDAAEFAAFASSVCKQRAASITATRPMNPALIPITLSSIL
jgi:hypothetical protein